MADAARVFISYSSQDADLVDRLKTALAQAGVAVWLDHEQLTPDTLDWQEAVRKGILQATHVIYTASPTAARSQFVIHEIEMARGESKHVVAFWVRGEKWYDCVPMGWILAQYTDARDAAYVDGVVKLLTALGVASPPLTPAAPQQWQEVSQLKTKIDELPLRDQVWRLPLPSVMTPRQIASEAGVEEELTRNLSQVLTKAKIGLENLSRAAPERFMLDLSLLLGGVSNDLLGHYARLSRTLRAQGDSTPEAAARRIEQVVGPLLDRTMQSFRRIEGLVVLEHGQLFFEDLRTISKVVRGQELVACYWDATRMLRSLMREIYDLICADEVGAARSGQPFEELWVEFLRDLDLEMGRLNQWYTWQV